MPEPAANIHYLIYTSHAVRPFSQQDLLNLLQVSRRNNLAGGITGMLLYRDSMVVQFLEGHLNDLTRLIEKIALDTRHEQVKVLIQGESKVRTFPDWSMAFRDMTGEEATRIAGFTDCLEANGPQPEALHDLLAIFEIVRQASAAGG